MIGLVMMEMIGLLDQSLKYFIEYRDSNNIKFEKIFILSYYRKYHDSLIAYIDSDTKKLVFIFSTRYKRELI